MTLIVDGELHMELEVDNQTGQKSVRSVSPMPCDVLVLQRPLARLLSEAIPMIQANGTAVVVELDDDFSSIHRHNLAWKQVQPSLSPDTNWHWLSRSCALADAVTCSTPAIARKYGAAGRTFVVHNYLPEVYRTLDINDDMPEEGWKLGWSGSIATHPTDLQVASTGVQRALSELDAELHILGTGVGVAEALGVDAEDVHAGEWVPIDEYPQAMADPHIGMVPLARIPFNEAKSWLKGLEYAGAGVPFVATPTAEYERLFRLGVGRKCKKPLDWMKHFKALRERGVWQHEQGTQREFVLDNMMIESHVEEWTAAWYSALAVRRSLHQGPIPDDPQLPGGVHFTGPDIVGLLAEHDTEASEPRGG